MKSLPIAMNLNDNNVLSEAIRSYLLDYILMPREEGVPHSRRDTSVEEDAPINRGLILEVTLL